MKVSAVDRIVEAVLYEGYILYPYRASSTKNRQRFTFGRIYPEAYSHLHKAAEPWVMQTECLAQTKNRAACIQVTVRFLHPIAREVMQPSALEALPLGDHGNRHRLVTKLEVDGKVYHTWKEAAERKIEGEPLPFYTSQEELPNAQCLPFVFPSARLTEPIRDKRGTLSGEIVRRQEMVEGLVEVITRPVDKSLFTITVRIMNRTEMGDEILQDPEAVLLRTFASAHTILRIEGGEFISMMDPPVERKHLASKCKNIGTWPILVGDEAAGERNIMLSSPIILYDYPRIAPESPGAFFDSTEIDELLSLRVMTMTEQERTEMSQVDEQGRRLLERTESLDREHLVRMHGVMRELRSFDEQVFGSNVPLQGVSVLGVHLRPGDKVRLRPKSNGDVMDLALAGRIGVIEAVEQDAEQRIHLALVIQDDPGMDLGLRRQPGHRFFFGVDEVEPVTEESR